MSGPTCPTCGTEVDGIRVLTEAEIGRSLGTAEPAPTTPAPREPALVCSHVNDGACTACVRRGIAAPILQPSAPAAPPTTPAPTSSSNEEDA